MSCKVHTGSSPNRAHPTPHPPTFAPCTTAEDPGINGPSTGKQLQGLLSAMGEQSSCTEQSVTCSSSLALCILPWVLQGGELCS